MAIDLLNLFKPQAPGWPFGAPPPTPQPTWGAPPVPGAPPPPSPSVQASLATQPGSPVAPAVPPLVGTPPPLPPPRPGAPPIPTGLPEPGGIARSNGEFILPAAPGADEAFRRPYDTPAPPPVDPDRMARPGQIYKEGSDKTGAGGLYTPPAKGTGGLITPSPTDKTGGLYDPNAAKPKEAEGFGKRFEDPEVKALLTGLGGGIGKMAGGGGGRGGGGMSFPGLGADPTAASRASAGQILQQLMAGRARKPVGPVPGMRPLVGGR